MSALAVVGAPALVDDFREFFAPAGRGVLEDLFTAYQRERAAIERVAEFVAGPDHTVAIGYFLSGNATEERGRVSMQSSAKQLFRQAGAIASLNAEYWDRALKMTDVLDVMPQARRTQWHEQIRKMECPDFERDVVAATIGDLLNSRWKFFAERVDGIFRGLSGEHVTNSPQAFGKRMIIARVLNEHDLPNWDKAGLIADLRCIIGRFMGMPEPKHGDALGLVRHCRERRGEWVSIDGGALRMRVYKVGTAHLEVHPDMAWRLNSVLASIYPLAIPAAFREKPARRPKHVPLLQRPLLSSVCGALLAMEPASRRVAGSSTTGWRDHYMKVPRTYWWRHSSASSGQTGDETAQVLAALGGVKTEDGWAFDYDALDLIHDVGVSGCMPDQKSHQFYPTPEALGRVVVELADIGAGHSVLEPSAGIGGLADLVPDRERVTCVEASELHAKVLRAKGYFVHCMDFLQWADGQGQRFHRVIMNPPFSDGRAAAHLDAAMRLLSPGGKLVAVLPSGLAGFKPPAGYSVECSSPISGAFPGVSIDVVLLQATRQSATS